MRTSKWLIVALLAASMAQMDATAQSSKFSIGPQVSIFGVGGSASVQMGQYLSISAEYNYWPDFTADLEASDINYSLEPSISGGILGIHLHPFKGKFSVGAGVVFGEFGLTGESKDLTGTISIGDDTFLVTDVGTLKIKAAVEGPWPAVMLGWRGKGFNFGVGAVMIGNLVFTLDATGPIKDDAAFLEAIDREIDAVDNDVDYGVLPLIRLGWQIGF